MNPQTDDIVPKGILETVTYCRDLIAARQFYESVVGLRLVSEEPGRHLFFQVGNQMLLIFNPEQTRSATVQVGQQIIPRHGPEGSCHFAFEVEPHQLGPIKHHLQAHRVAIESEIDWPGGGHSLYCRDPAGNSVEFATRSLWFSDPAFLGRKP